ncbi:hypothetical protein [Pedobacter sp. Leaf132]|uniref:hypothetical protein n=1 Tax=Pedobacter sp. Leaf132 TaxID=2876557 RepID=UPI001E385F57|nr:hypothetical protein [Pedobacter sp. Leaf132]
MSRNQANGNPDFHPDTKFIIAARAGFRCSYPKCDKLLIGPGTESNKVTNLGDCGHIFAASPIGPRTNGGLNPQQLAGPQNGIFLCKHHHGLVDRRWSNNIHTSDMLIRYKDRHEFHISAEIGEHHYPMNWINAFSITNSSLFSASLKIMLGKVNFIVGDNNTGKSLIMDVIYATLTRQLEPRLHRRNFRAECMLEFDNPILPRAEISMNHTGEFVYQMKDSKEAFLPYHINVLFLRNELTYSKDDLGDITKCLRLSRSFLKTHLQNLDLKDGLYAKGIQIVERRRKPYQIDLLYVRTESSKDFYMPFRDLSSSEKFLTIVDILVSLANHLAAFQTVLLLVDWNDLFHFDKDNMSKVLELLRSKSSMFQSIVASPHSYLDVDWTGWVIANLQGGVPNITVRQNTLD